MVTAIRPPRVESPARWQRALERAITEGIEVRQLAGAGCGGWIATSGSDPTIAYELLVSGNVCHGCTCPAGTNGDLCKHRAAYYRLVGALDLAPSAPLVQMTRCPDCLGAGYIKIWTGSHLTDWIPGSCRDCNGTGEVVDQLAA